ncbi:DUF4843 domain-containing protein [Carboxylicivirga marina]|uniref:DUF4843 domain-containing protein n=1 Tax=Carboxylicivirga marina TaxID=2800988 RepID=A0ABS1HDV0_9BACT|nr:DUF4843 domain-containing protein [Carboxylicivirga marina]MBK3515844.1 DUF4843 domain-containing protein [Carboxylicivirga marina]
MNLNKYIRFLVIGVIFCACEPQALMTYIGVDRLQFVDAKDFRYSFVYEPKTVTSDTVWVTVQTMGDVYDYDRAVSLVQVFEEEWTYTYDELGNKIDSLFDIRNDQAESGIHFIPLSEHTTFKVSANTARANLPIVVLRDVSLVKDSYRLRLRISPNDYFEEGVKDVLEKTIIISDVVVKPNGWDDIADKYLFGEYGPVKHRFIIDILGLRIDDDFFKMTKADISLLNYYNSKVKTALYEYNIANPDNPLREEPKDGDIEGALVTFPNGV